MKKHNLILLPLLSAILWSCIKENPEQNTDSGFLHGAFITNEGAMGNSNASISHLDLDSLRITNHLFESVNGRPLGDVVHSLTIAGSKGFIVVNNSQKVEVVDMATFKSIGVIDGLEYPRFLVARDSLKGYLSDGNYGGRVYVIDFTKLEITDTLPCGKGPENMLLHENYLYVCNSGGFDKDSTITVIDTRINEVAEIWQTGYNPSDLVMDKNKRLWVLCKGKVEWNPDWTIGMETPSEIRVIDPSSGLETNSFEIGNKGDFYWPAQIGINHAGDRIYFLESEGLFSLDVSDAGSSIALLIPGVYYGFGIEPVTEILYTLVCPSFTTSGQINRYAPGGSLLDSFEAGIGPNRVVFN